MRAKICGIRNLDDAITAISAGANAVGFLVGITHLAEDKISKEEAKDIIEKIPPFVSKVMVTHLLDKEEITGIARFLGVDTIQIQDHIPPEDLDQLKSELPYCKIIKAIHVTDRTEALKMLGSFERHCDAILLDSRTEDRLGGTGITHDWNISREIVEKASCPVILAGGLNGANVFDAVKQVRPYAVDVNSGVEVDGYKSFDKIKAFISNAIRAKEKCV